ncbi:sulfatase-like hydrolase/transferase [Myxococcota bacterium]|nr:sulfatase-like hydrolase/transferase [Myxococcota bacterium]
MRKIPFGLLATLLTCSLGALAEPSSPAPTPQEPGLRELTTSRDPWQKELDRKEFNGETRPVLSGRSQQFRLTVPPHSGLEIGYAVWSPLGYVRNLPVKFRVVFEDEQGRQVLLDRRIPANTPKSYDRWHDTMLSLEELAGRTGTLTLEASRRDATPAPLAFWNPPRLRTERNSTQPNLILLSIDTLRADHLGSYGYTRPTSPNIDRMAAEGVRFDQAFATSNWTLPSHASLFTGRLPWHHGARHYGLGSPLPPDETTLAEILWEENYDTAGFVGGVFVTGSLGFDQGFDQYVDPGYATFKTVPFRETLRRAKSWMQTRRGRPFFAFLHTYQVHMPYTPPTPYDRMFDDEYEGPFARSFSSDDYAPYRWTDALDPRVVDHIRALYDGGIRQTDQEVGDLMRFIETHSEVGDTCIVLLSDHGEEFKEHDNLLHHSPKLYEELIRIPLIFWCPTLFEGGRVVDAPVSLVDVLPTLAQLAGVSPPEGLDGSSLHAALHGGTLDPQRVAFAEVSGSTQEKPGSVTAVRTHRFKLISSSLGGQERLELYDLESDPGEQRDIAAENPDVVSELTEYLRHTGAPSSENSPQTTPEWDADPMTLKRLRELGYIH